MKKKDKKIAHKIALYMLDKKAKDIKIIKIDKISSIADYMIICSSDSSPQTKAITNYIKDKLFEEEKIKPWHIEGYENLKWVLIDYVNIIVNIFSNEYRKYYNIERLWADGDLENIK